MPIESTLPPLVLRREFLDLTARTSNMAIVSLTAEEIREEYFEGADPELEPTTGLTGLGAVLDDHRALEEKLFGWTHVVLVSGWPTYRALWYSWQQLAAIVISTGEVYLFVFADVHALLAALEPLCRRTSSS